SVINDNNGAATIQSAVRDIAGADALLAQEPSMGGEDYSYMTNSAPGAMFMLGAKLDEINRPHHNPLFDLDESVFKTGAAVLAETACRLLTQLA
ncbi:MAG: M20/M25/M40 family metallo-hydrolase, partial [Anaerolineae bacterium]|nr:M20/M25/M40 family metallo-hydrolase [Anaerolineae bacterium]